MCHISTSEFYKIYYDLKKNLNYKNDYFHIICEALSHFSGDIWKKCSSSYNFEQDKPIGYRIQHNNNKFTDKLLRDMVEVLCNINKKDDSLIRRDINSSVSTFCSSTKLFSERLSDQYPKDYIASTKLFIQKCLSFDKTLSWKEIVQALRNVWTTNLLQSIFKEQVQVTDAIFGYSLLYPYTDNLLDNKDTHLKNKLSFANRISYKLSGKMLISVDVLESKVFTLIDYIKKQYCIPHNDLLYKCLQAINRYQFTSTKLDTKQSAINSEELISITCEKGGMSVLTDGFLINGTVSIEQLLLCYMVGVLLQLLDDFQDMISDRRCLHNTLFTEAISTGTLEAATNKLFNFTDEVSKFILFCSKSKFKQEISDAITHYCRILIYFSINRNRKYYSKAYLSLIKKHYPYTSGYMDKFNKKLKKVLLKAKDLNIDISQLLDIII